ncbi:MAG: STAS/SEC14 domain-containing protein [Cyanobacteria bacterium J06621_11]
MATVKIKSDVGTEQLLEGVAQLETSELENFLTQASLLLAQRKATALPTTESDLLKKINQGLPTDIQQRYDALREKLRQEELSSAEHKELLEFVDVVEQASAERLQHLIALSQLRQVSLDELFQQLDIHPPTVHG